MTATDPTIDAEAPVARFGPLARARAVTDLVWWRAHGLQAALLATPVVLFAYAVWEHRYSIEDGFIYYRIADNLAFGDGPVFNAGERVEAYTSPAWLLVLGLARASFGGVMQPGLQAAILSTIASTAAMGLGVYGSWRLQRAVWATPDRSCVAVPFGAIAVLAAPAMWYFGTSGLETGLCFAWVAGAFALVAARTASQVESAGGEEGGATGPGVAERWRVDRPRAALVVLGLGWLMRPELMLYSVGFCAVWLGLTRGTMRQRAAAVGWMVAVPAAYQLFRMGYFAAMVPNTAIAKGAARSNWDVGWSYVVDFLSYDRLNLPLLLAAAALVATVVRSARAVGRRRLVAVALVAPVVGALHALYVVRIGGDFQHARFMVIPYFTMLLPVFVAPVLWSPATRRVLRVVPVAAAVLVMVGWGVATGSKWGFLQTEPVYTELRFGMASGDRAENPLDVEDYGEGGGPIIDAATAARDAGRAGHPLLVNSIPADFGVGEAAYSEMTPGTRAALLTCCIGMRSVFVGPSVFVIDQYSLADPVGARLELDASSIFKEDEVGTPQPLPWVYARFRPVGLVDPATDAAASALECGDLAELQAAVHEDLSLGRFLSNVVSSPRFTTMRVPIDPVEAERTYCAED